MDSEKNRNEWQTEASVYTVCNPKSKSVNPFNPFQTKMILITCTCAYKRRKNIYLTVTKPCEGVALIPRFYHSKNDNLGLNHITNRLLKRV